MIRVTGLVSLWVAAACVVGCFPKHTTPTTAALKHQRESVGAERNFEKVWRAAIKVLRSYEFEIDRQDRRGGLITTKPLLGRHFFEVWRRDAVTYFDMTESTLQTIYKTVRVKVVPGRVAGAYEPKVEVILSRSNREVLGAPSVSDAYQSLFGGGKGEREDSMLAEDPEKARERSQTSVGVGREKTLAARLEAKIRREAHLAAPTLRPRAGKAPAHLPATRPAGKP